MVYDPAESEDSMAVDPLTADLKRSLLVAWEASGMTKAELARRLDCHYTEVKRILDPGTPTKLRRLEQVAGVLGGRIVVSMGGPQDGAGAATP